VIARRGLVAAICATATAGAGARAQSSRSPRIGAIHWETAAASERMEELRRPLREIGLDDGRNLAIEWRWAGRSAERAAEAVFDLQRLGVDLIFVHSTPTVRAVRDTGTSLPIVMFMSDPLAVGVVSNLARPGANITGVGTVGPELAPKRLELLRDLLPGLTRVAFIGSPLDPNTQSFLQETGTAGTQLGIIVTPVLIDGPSGLEDAFARMVDARVQAVIVQPLFIEQRTQIAALQMRHRIPAIADQPQFAQAGVLASYGPDRHALMSRVAAKIQAVLRGTRPGELPVELPTTFQFVLNQKTAASLGLRIPANLLARADEVIE
jgi:putative tryptophan/tyrosine transport system substrate-binding protein